MIGAGGLYFSDGFENSPSVPSSDWTMANPTGQDLFEYGTVSTCTNCVNQQSPTSASSTPYAFATGLDTSYVSGSFTPLEAFVYTPEYTIPLGASARIVFDHWVCTYSGYGGAALFISDDGGNTWDHFDSVDPITGQGWYHGANMYTGYSHILIRMVKV